MGALARGHGLERAIQRGLDVLAPDGLAQNLLRQLRQPSHPLDVRIGYRSTDQRNDHQRRGKD